VFNPFTVGRYAFLFWLHLTDQVKDSMMDSSLNYLEWIVFKFCVVSTETCRWLSRYSYFFKASRYCVTVIRLYLFVHNNVIMYVFFLFCLMLSWQLLNFHFVEIHFIFSVLSFKNILVLRVRFGVPKTGLNSPVVLFLPTVPRQYPSVIFHMYDLWIACTFCYVLYC
jgi:hypothetical protein